jgi:hypothetical protein
MSENRFSDIKVIGFLQSVYMLRSMRNICVELVIQTCPCVLNWIIIYLVFLLFYCKQNAGQDHAIYTCN